ncbi:MAG: hypothetical protein ABII75_03210 [Candidatus Omnitrophota bacterium]
MRKLSGINFSVKIIAALVFLFTFLPLPLLAGTNCNLLSPALKIQNPVFKIDITRLISDYFAENSLIGAYGYRALKLDVCFGARVDVLSLERDFKAVLSYADIIAFNQPKNTEEAVAIRLKVKKMFKDIIYIYGINQYSAAMEEYFNKIMQVLNDELKKKGEILKNDPIIFKEALKDILRKLDPEDVLIFSQPTNTHKKNELRGKIKSTFERFAAENGVIFEEYEAWKYLERVMKELRQEFINRTDDFLRQRRAQIITILASELTADDLRHYFEEKILPATSPEREIVRLEVKRIFNNWLKANNLYFEGANCRYIYQFRLENIMPDVLAQKQDDLAQQCREVIEPLNSCPPLRISEKAAVFRPELAIGSSI